MKNMQLLFSDIHPGKVLDISHIQKDGTNVRMINRPASSSRKKQIGNYDVYSDSKNAIRIFQQLVGNYGLIDLWNKK